LRGVGGLRGFVMYSCRGHYSKTRCFGTTATTFVCLVDFVTEGRFEFESFMNREFQSRSRSSQVGLVVQIVRDQNAYNRVMK